ncbi:MAG: rRNA (guanine527-N7)-methyltransferase [Solirubrobacteraceae bacterium]|jgi:16S rRNA (guanine527-N7)-methyltransferase|nr:rRNA (guanine527-N7)-methyltransferase [Solirubrobacteraceae bacterium]
MGADLVARRVRGLSERYQLPRGASEQLERLLAVVSEDPHAPTAVRTPEEAVDVHVADALMALDLPQVRAAQTLADLGSGAGFPGLVLAVALPDTRVSLVESNGRKCAFLSRAIAELDLANAEAVPARAESWDAGIGSCDVVTARALASLNVVVEYAAPLLREGGALVAWKGKRDAREEQDAAAAAAATGLEAVAVRPVRPWDDAEHHHLHVYLKVGLTPNRYPRRPGMASKRPLRAST